jgi:hypothetical protein
MASIPRQQCFCQDDFVGKSQPVGAVGSGYNTFYQSAMPSQVQASNIDPVTGSISTNVYVCTTTQQMLQSIDISAGMGANTMWGNFQARVDFVHSVQTTTSSVTVFVAASKISGGQNLRVAQFSETPTSALNLFRQGGDSYVSSISTGGQFMAAYSFASYDEITYDSLVATADAEFSVAGREFDAHFAAKLEAISQKTGVTYNFKQFGIGFSSAWPGPDQLVDFVLNWHKLDMDQPAILEFSTQSYTVLEDCPSGFNTIDGYRLQWDDDTAIDPGTILSNVVVLAQSNQRTIRATREMFDFYGCPDVEPRLAPANAKLVEILHNISTWRTTVQADPTKLDIKVPTWNEEDLKYPVSQWTIITATGGPILSGPAFSDISLDMVPKLIRPLTVSARGGDSIDSITTTYLLQNSDVHEYNPPRHGGTGGEILELSPSDQETRSSLLRSSGGGVIMR